MVKLKMLMLSKVHESIDNDFAELFRRAENNDEVEVIYTHIRAINFSKYPNLKYVLCPCTNIRHLKDVPKDVKVFHLDKGRWLYMNVLSTAEWNIQAIFNLMKHNKEEVSGKSICFVGYGRVAQQMARMLQRGFGCSIYFYDINKFPEYYNGYADDVDMDDIWTCSDIISINLSENSNTVGFVEERAFRYMRENVKKPYFLNSSRSSIVDQKYLIEAIEDDIFSGIALDVIDDYTEENKIKLYELCEIRNMIVTPHIAGQCHISRAQTDVFVLNKLLKEIEDE